MDQTATRPSNIEALDEPTTHREVEAKFSVDSDFTLPDLALTGMRVEALPTVRLTATYFDTEDLRLARHGITLRRRTGGRDSGWHLKLPIANDEGVRDEVRLPLKAGRTVPTALSQLVLALTQGAELSERAVQKTQRRGFQIYGRDDSPAVEVVDDRVTITSGPFAGTQYREVEVEVVRESEILPIVTELLGQAGAQPSSSKSKGVRAVAGDQPLPPAIPEPERARPKDPASAAITSHIRTHVKALLEQDMRIRRGMPDAVHQFRVAARRLRSGFQAFAPLLEEEWANHMRAELGWIAGVLGAARDREVLENRLFASIRQLPANLDRAAAFVAVQTHLESELAQANDQIHSTLNSPRYLALLDTLSQAAQQAPTTQAAAQPASVTLPPLVKKRWKKLARDAKRLPDELLGHDDHWHHTRITAKKARYSVEACIPVFGSPAKKLAKQLEQVTELLGEHQDCAVAADTVKALITKDTGPRAAFALGALYTVQRQRTAEIRREFVEAWPRISHTEWRKWLSDRDVR